MFRELGATAPQTYQQFRTSNGAGDVLYVFLNSLTAQGLQALFFSKSENVSVPLNKARTSRLINKRKRKGDFFFVKTTADVRQL